MYITWYGQSCFKIQGDKVTVVTDPFDNTTGLKVPRLAADIVTLSDNQDSHTNAKSVKGISNESLFIIESPGEYEIRDVFVYGISNFDDKSKGKNTIYRIEIDNLTLVHLGGMSQPLTNGQMEQLKQVDILFIPVGGGPTIDSKTASGIINQIEPRVVIPMHYKIPGLNIKLDSLDKFCKEIGVCPTESLPKYKIAKKDLPVEEMQVITLSKS